MQLGFILKKDIYMYENWTGVRGPIYNLRKLWKITTTTTGTLTTLG